jgi:hypothetical protein
MIVGFFGSAAMVKKRIIWSNGLGCVDRKAKGSGCQRFEEDEDFSSLQVVVEARDPGGSLAENC